MLFTISKLFKTGDNVPIALPTRWIAFSDLFAPKKLIASFAILLRCSM